MWEEIYRKHYTELVRYAASACGNASAAEDIAQEVFLKAMQSGDTFLDLGPSQRRAWLYRTLKNYLIDLIRRARLLQALEQDLTEEACYWEPGMEQIENALLVATLPPQDQVLFHLRYEQGMSAAEIAQTMGIPSGTVRSRLSRARAILRHNLTDI